MAQQERSSLAGDLEEIVSRLAPKLKELRGERLFITGGTGFFGKWLLETLAWVNKRLAADISATVLTRNSGRFLEQMPQLAGNGAIGFVHGDIRNFSFPPGHFSHLIHMATTSAEATFADEPPLEKFTTTVQGTQRVLEFATRCGAGKILLTSSGNAYGPVTDHPLPVSEEYPGAPDITRPVASALGEAKRAAELLARIHAGMNTYEVKICRCFTFIGPYLQTDIHYAAGNFIRDAINGGPIRVRGNGTPVRSFLYPTDLLVWLLTILFDAPSGRLYNVGSSEPVSIGELAGKIAGQAGCSATIENSSDEKETSSPDYYFPETTRIVKELKVEQTVDLDTAIIRTLNYYRAPGFR